MAIEIDDKAAADLLSAKTQSPKSMGTESFPEDALRFGHVAAQATGCSGVDSLLAITPRKFHQ